MRVIKYLVFASVILLYSCSGNGPEKTVEQFYAAVKANDFEKAKSLSTESSHSVLNLLSSGVDVSIGEGKLTNVDCATENETSVCDCFFENNSTPVPITALKENGVWKVDVQATAKNMMNNVLDKIKGIDLSGVDVNGIMDMAKEITEGGTGKINDLLENVNPDQISKAINGIDSSLNITNENVEELMNKISEGLDKTSTENSEK